MSIPLDQPNQYGQDINAVLVDYPDKVADALEDWRMAALERERMEAKTYLTLKANNAVNKITESWLENMVIDDTEVYKARLTEIKAETSYQRVLEKLLCAKKRAAIREAF